MAVLIRCIAAFGALALAVAPAGAQSPAPVPSASASASPLPRIHAHRTIATLVGAAQIDFDRGLIMLYAFNVGAARIDFRAAEVADPHATLAYVGEALTDTIDINSPSTPDGEERGAAAIARGRAAAALAPPDESALYAAVALRFAPKRSLKDRYRAYWDAMRAYATAHPADGMGQTLAAYAGWNAIDELTAGDDHHLVPGAKSMIAELDAALALDPDDAGAHHLRIHFWETAFAPERARSDADYFAEHSYDLGESHLQHMAGHIYYELGMYAPMIAVNEGACANDDAYFATGDGPGQEYMRTYHFHDADFVVYGLTTVGRNADAKAFAAHESAYVRELVDARLHDSRAVLADRGGIDTQRVVAEARLGEIAAATRDLGKLSGADGALNVDVARAQVALARHDTAGALAEYKKAYAAFGPYNGDPKRSWWSPIGEGYGAVLLAAGQPAAAETVFRAELVRFPNDPRLLFGLAEALKDQAKDDTAARAAATSNWQGPAPLTRADLG